MKNIIKFCAMLSLVLCTVSAYSYNYTFKVNNSSGKTIEDFWIGVAQGASCSDYKPLAANDSGSIRSGDSAKLNFSDQANSVQIANVTFSAKADGAEQRYACYFTKMSQSCNPSLAVDSARDSTRQNAVLTVKSIADSYQVQFKSSGDGGDVTVSCELEE